MAEFYIKHSRTALERIEKALSPRYFTDVNLRGRLYDDVRPISGLTVHHAAERISFQDAQSSTYESTQIGDAYGPTWSTHWFRIDVEVPEEWTCEPGDAGSDDAECDEVHLLWECEGECLLFRDGQPVAGLTMEGEKTSYIIGRARSGTSPSSSTGGYGTVEAASGREEETAKDVESKSVIEKTATPIDLTTSTKRALPPARSFTAYVEMACNGLIGTGQGFMIAPPESERKFALKRAAVALFRRDVYELLVDLEVIYEVACSFIGEADGRKGEPLGYHALHCGNAIVNVCADAPRPGPAAARAPTGNDGDTREWVRRARAISREFFSEPRAGRGGGADDALEGKDGRRPAGGPGMEVHAMGHCHIDTAWLWPYEETVRKCARSWTTALQLMDSDPEFKFVCSQAQQLSWLKQRYPRSLYPRVRAAAARGAFVPVGGTWVEFDGNLPSGESLVRQFLLGQRFFLREFGARCGEFWLPDTFGYSAQLPQIMSSCGARRFVTQKLSWNLVNAFPHSTSHWEGLDGTRVLTHFPPVESYECKVSVAEILKSASNNRDKGRTRHALLLFGFGDGGGGPTPAMLDRLHRIRRVPGLPRVSLSTPTRFFNEVAAELDEGERGGGGGGGGGVGRLCTWSGELFLELHNGTYTTQARIKRGNRRCEALLRDAEVLCCVALLAQSPVYTADRAAKGEMQNERKSGITFESVSALPGANASIGSTDGKVNDGGDEGSYECDDDDDEEANALGYPYQPLMRLWEGILLNQFHDVLPGSCTRQVVLDAEEIYNGVENDAGQIVRDAMAAVVGRKLGTGDFPSDLVTFFNTLGWERTEVAALPGCHVNGVSREDRVVPSSKIIYGRYVQGEARVKGDDSEKGSHTADGINSEGNSSTGLVLVTVPAFGYSIYSEASLLASAAKCCAVVLHHDLENSAVMENELLRVTVDGAGRLTSLIHKPSGREAVIPGQKANQLVMFDDIPLYWDAWDVMDYHLETRKPQEHSLEPLQVLTNAVGIRVAVRACLRLGERSQATMDISLDAGSPFVRFDVTASWYENRRFLKTEFPVAVRSSGGEATYEIQFGHVRRPTHRNTPWDWSRYEVWAHRWAHLGEHGFGLALLNDCKYGYSARGNVLSLSLLRSPKAPDPEADMGEHTFSYAAMPHEGSFQDAGIIRYASTFNHPLTAHRTSFGGVTSGVQKSSTALSIDPKSSSNQDVAMTSGVSPAAGAGLHTKQIFHHGFFSVEPSSVVVETLKLAEGWPGHGGNHGAGVVLVARLYESHGGAAVARLRCRCSPDLPLISAVQCNMLEDVDDTEPPLIVKDEGADDDDKENMPQQANEGDGSYNQKQAKGPQSVPAWRCVHVPFKAFQIRTLMLHFGQPTAVPW